VSVNTGSPPGFFSLVSNAVADALAVSSYAAYGAHFEAILTNNVCHRLSEVISCGCEGKESVLSMGVLYGQTVHL